ncbi:MAG TPA: hypothetical protein PLL53_10585 [Saprospiraceae bacterium]|nr:hypothetical protein [Saprospiraceae bacterium]
MDIKKIRIDEFTAVVQPDPKSLKEVIYLEGYIGKSNEANHVRLFFDRALTDFIDIDSEDILHVVPNAKEEDTLGGSKLWIRAKASYKYGDPELKKRPEAGFMEGDIYQMYKDQFETPTSAEQATTLDFYKNSFICTHRCPSRVFRCLATPLCSPNTPCCRTPKFPCQFSPGTPCQPQVTLNCLSTVCGINHLTMTINYANMTPTWGRVFTPYEM